MTNNVPVKPEITPDDTISDIESHNISIDGQKFSIFTVASWDNSIHIYTIHPGRLETALIAQYKDPERDAILQVTYNKDYTKLFYGTARGNIKVLTIPQYTQIPPQSPITISQPSTIGQLAGPIIGLRFSTHIDKLVSVSADKVLCIWDIPIIASSTSTPKSVVVLPHTPISMDIQGNFANVLVSQSINIQRIELRNPSRITEVPLKDCESPFVIKCCGKKGDGKTVIVGTLHSAVHYQDDKNANVIFTAHYNEASSTSFASNCLAYDPDDQSHVISGGGNGSICFFNFASGKKITEKSVAPNNIPITALSIINQFVIVAIGYDWHKGVEEINAKGTLKPTIFVKRIAKSDFG